MGLIRLEKMRKGQVFEVWLKKGCKKCGRRDSFVVDPNVGAIKIKIIEMGQ